MNELMKVVLSLSLSGSLTALIFFLLKPLWKNRLSKTWQYYIFLVVILRFILPFGTESRFMSAVFEPPESNIKIEETADSMPAIDNMVLPAQPIEEQMPPDEVHENSEGNLEKHLNNALPGKQSSQVAEWLWLIWLTLPILLFIRKVIGYHRFVRSCNMQSTRIEDEHIMDAYFQVCQSMKIKRPPSLVENRDVAAPMLAGLIHPVIVLPDMGLNMQEMQHVLCHELTHYKRMDSLYKWLVEVAVCLHWCNPFVYWVRKEIARCCELSCDEMVIKGLNKESQLIYGDVLLKNIKPHAKPSYSAFSLTLNEDAGLIKERLEAIMKYHKKSKATAASSVLLAVFLVFGAASLGVYAVGVQKDNNYAVKLELDQEIKIATITSDHSSSQTVKINFPIEIAESGKKIQLSADIFGDGIRTVELIAPDGVSARKYYLNEDGFLADSSKECLILKNRKVMVSDVAEQGIWTVKITSGDSKSDKLSLFAKLVEPNVFTFNTDDKAEAGKPQTVVYERVEMRQGDLQSYAHHVTTNNTSKKIIRNQRGMLAFDKQGNPLKIRWQVFDSGYLPSYYFLYDWGSSEIDAGGTYDVSGGWSLNYNGRDPEVDKIAYVLYSDKEIAFEDGTVWENPDFEAWRSTYEGKRVDVEILDNYYPYQMVIQNTGGGASRIEGLSVVYEQVEMQLSKNEGDYNYITSLRTNHTPKTITSSERGMLAFDKNGNPLEIDWWARDKTLNYRYYCLHSGLAREIKPGEQDEQSRGWRLNSREFDPTTENIAYILYCDKEITFEDGSVWKNPNFETWRSTYEGNAVDVETLKNYYPYKQEITF